MDEPSENVQGCGDIFKDKVNWLLEHIWELLC